MYDTAKRREVADLIAANVTPLEISRITGVGYTTIYRWHPPDTAPNVHCFRCSAQQPHPTYAYLLGQYLGDGYIAPSGRSTALRIFCSDAYPLIISEVASAMVQVAQVSVNFRELLGCTQVQSATNHWKCMLPQHGPGTKHTRPIVLTDWQRDIVVANPQGLIRGLIHSDGCRSVNTIHRQLPSGVKTYEYPRYFFSNMSKDIHGIFTDALDQLDIAWKWNRFNSISIARREAVAALDEFVGPKS